MAHSKNKRSKARNMYVQTRCEILTISAALDVPEGTLRRWKAAAKESGDDWDIARAASTMKGEGLESMVSAVIEDFTVMFQVTMEQVKDDSQIEPGAKVKLMASLSDSFNKMILAAGRTAPKLNEMAVAMDVIQRLAEFIRVEFKQHNTAFEEILEPFGAEVVKVYQS